MTEHFPSESTTVWRPGRAGCLARFPDRCFLSCCPFGAGRPVQTNTRLDATSFVDQPPDSAPDFVSLWWPVSSQRPQGSFKSPCDWDTWADPWLSVFLRLRSWSRGPGIESHIRLPAWSLLLPLPVSLPLSVCLSWINNKNIKKINKK